MTDMSGEVGEAGEEDAWDQTRKQRREQGSIASSQRRDTMEVQTKRPEAGMMIEQMWKPESWE